MTKQMRLRQLQVLHRHGDRTPLHNILRGGSNVQAEQEENQQWESKLPTRDHIRDLGYRFPANFPPSTDAEKSKSKIQDMQLSSHHVMQHRPYGYLTWRGLDEMASRGSQLMEISNGGGLDVDQLRPEDVQVFSNTYTRTQLSVQSLLTGMLAQHPFLSPTITILPPDQDFINAYTMYPEVGRMKALMVKESDEMVAREKEMEERRKDLMGLLPALASESVAFSWMDVFDYYICREAHDVPLIPGTEEHRDATLQHLIFRFNKYFSNRDILQKVAGPLIENAREQMELVTKKDRREKSLVVYSGHDTSVLSTLHALGADVVDREEYWPHYSSALTLELLEDDQGAFFVRACLNGQEISKRDDPSMGIYTLEEFQHLVKTLKPE